MALVAAAQKLSSSALGAAEAAVTYAQGAAPAQNGSHCPNPSVCTSTHELALCLLELIAGTGWVVVLITAHHPELAVLQATSRRAKRSWTGRMVFCNGSASTCRGPKVKPMWCCYCIAAALLPHCHARLFVHHHVLWLYVLDSLSWQVHDLSLSDGIVSLPHCAEAETIHHEAAVAAAAALATAKERVQGKPLSDACCITSPVRFTLTI